MSEKSSSHRSRKSIVTAGAALATSAVLVAGCSSQNSGPSKSEIRAAGAQEAMYYGEASQIASNYEAGLRAGKRVTMSVLTGKIIDKPNVVGAAKEYKTISDPIFLIPGPDTKDGTATNDTTLDGGFVGVQSAAANGQVEINVVPFDKETMHFEPADRGPSFTTPLSSIDSEVKTLHGAVQGDYAVAINTLTDVIAYDPSGVATIPGYAPHQSR